MLTIQELDLIRDALEYSTPYRSSEAQERHQNAIALIKREGASPMNPKQWIDTVEKYMGRKARPYEQRYIARALVAAESNNSANEDSALSIAKKILGNDRNATHSIFRE